MSGEGCLARRFLAALFYNFVIWNQEHGQSRRSKRRANQAYLHETWCADKIPPQDHFGSVSRWERAAPALSGWQHKGCPACVSFVEDEASTRGGALRDGEGAEQQLRPGPRLV